MSVTTTALAGIALDDFAFTIPFHRGFEARPFTVRMGLQRHAEVRAAAKAQGQADAPVRLACSWAGRALSVPVWIAKINPVEGFEFDVVLMDRRLELLRIVCPLDLNVTYGPVHAHVPVDDDSGSIPQRSRAYVDGSAKDGQTPHDLPSAIQKLQDVLEATYAGKSPITKQSPLNLGPGVSEYITGRRVLDNTFLAGLNVLDALEILLTPHGLDLWVSPDGKFYLLLSRKNGFAEDTIPERFLTGVDWVNQPPAFASEIGENFIRPKTVVSWYQRYEEIAARTAETTEAAPAKIEYRIENVFRTPRGEWVTLADLAAAYDVRMALLDGLTTLALFNAVIAKWLYSTTWSTTSLQQTAYESDFIAGPAEALRVQIAKDIVAAIQRHWRRTYRIYAVGPLGRGLSTFGSPLARGHYRDLDFASIKAPNAAVDADKRNEINNEQHELLPVTYRSGKSVRCAWVDIFNHPIYPDGALKDKRRRELMALLRFDRNNASGVAPFDCEWIDRDQLIFDVLPEAGHNIEDRIPGRLTEGGSRKLIDPNENADLKVKSKFANSTVYKDIGGVSRIVQSDDGVLEVLPQLDADLSLRVHFTGVLQYPPDDKKRYYEAKTETQGPAAAGTWYLPVPSDRFAIFSALDRDVPVNADAVKKDAAQTAEAFIARLDQMGPGYHYAHGPDVATMIPEGAVEGYDVEYRSMGPGTLLTRVSFGGYRRVPDAHIQNEQAQRGAVAAGGVAK